MQVLMKVNGVRKSAQDGFLIVSMEAEPVGVLLISVPKDQAEAYPLNREFMINASPILAQQGS